MKNIFILIFLFELSLHGQTKTVMDKIIDNRVKFYNEEIPDTFKFFYKRFFFNDSSVLLNQLSNVTDTFVFNRKGEQYLVFLEALGIPSFNVYGLFWSNDKTLSFNILNDSTIIFHDKEFKQLKLFLNDIIEWNENVTNRSFVRSVISGASLILCTRVKGDTIQTTAFAFYDKNCDLIYFRETKDDWEIPKYRYNSE